MSAQANDPQARFTPRARHVLELALREALSLGHNYVATEHILLAIMRENEGVAVAALQSLGADAENVRQAVTRELQRPKVEAQGEERRIREIVRDELRRLSRPESG